MKARIKFRKYGSMKFIGHLDVMRYFQKLFRRAEIDNEYSKGFSPHQIMSFAAPLGVGLTSDGEYLDVSLLSSDSPEMMIKRMNEVITEGFHVIDFQPLLDREENQRGVTAMSLVSSADYLVSLKDGYSLGEIKSQEDFRHLFDQYMSQTEIVLDKKTKTSEKAVDIRPMITLTAYSKEEYLDKLQKTLKPLSKDKKHYNNFESAVTAYENGIKVYLQLDTGSAANLKPELVMDGFYQYLNMTFEKLAWQVHRLEVYTRDLESNQLISLDNLER